MATLSDPTFNPSGRRPVRDNTTARALEVGTRLFGSAVEGVVVGETKSEIEEAQQSAGRQIEGIQSNLQQSVQAIEEKRQEALEATNRALEDGTVSEDERLLIDKLTDEANRLTLAVKHRRINPAAAEARIRNIVKRQSRLFPTAAPTIRATGEAAISGFSGLRSRDVLKEEFPQLLEEQKRINATINKVATDMASFSPPLDYYNPLHRAIYAREQLAAGQRKRRKEELEIEASTNPRVASRKKAEYYSDVVNDLSTDLFEIFNKHEGDIEQLGLAVQQRITLERTKVESYAAGLSTIDEEAADDLVDDFNKFSGRFLENVEAIPDLTKAARDQLQAGLDITVAETFTDLMILNRLGISPEVRVKMTETLARMTESAKTRFREIYKMPIEQAMTGMKPDGTDEDSFVFWMEQAQRGEVQDPREFKNRIYSRVFLDSMRASKDGSNGNNEEGVKEVTESAYETLFSNDNPEDISYAIPKIGRNYLKNNPELFKRKLMSNAAYFIEQGLDQNNIASWVYNPSLSLIAGLDSEGRLVGFGVPYDIEPTSHFGVNANLGKKIRIDQALWDYERSPNTPISKEAFTVLAQTLESIKLNSKDITIQDYLDGLIGEGVKEVTDTAHETLFSNNNPEDISSELLKRKLTSNAAYLKEQGLDQNNIASWEYNSSLDLIAGLDSEGRLVGFGVPYSIEPDTHFGVNANLGKKIRIDQALWDYERSPNTSIPKEAFTVLAQTLEDIKLNSKDITIQDYLDGLIEEETQE